MQSLQIEEIPLGDRRMSDFVDATWHVHRGEPHWTPPLKADLLGSRLLGMKGLLTPAHPYHRHAEVTHFVARRGREPVGTVSAAINHRFNDYHHTQIGFFGFFSTSPDFAVASALLDQARQWVRARGMHTLRGPGEYSNATHERQGVLIEGFEHPPTVELTHNPPYYGEFLTRYGFTKAKDYYAYYGPVRPDPTDARLERLAAAAERHYGLRTRMIDMKRLPEEIRLLASIYNDAWEKNWGFLPITDEEADALAHTLQPVVIPELISFAYVRDEAAAVCGTLPDLYVPLRPRWRWPDDTDGMRMLRLLVQRRRIPRLRGMFFGIRAKFRHMGLDAILFYQQKKYALAHGYETCEASMMLEDNAPIQQECDALRGTRYKTWRIYDLDL